MLRYTTVIAVFFLLCLFSGNRVLAQNSERSLDLSFNATQATYSNSWIGGEAGNVAWVANVSGIFKNKLSEVLTMKNSIKLAFGQTISQDQESKSWSKPVKSTDKIDLESVGLFNIMAYIEPYAALRFESQFQDASVISQKRFVNPILLTASAGIAKQLYKKEKNDIISRFGFAFKENLNREILEDDSSKTEMKTSTDGGFESVTDIKLTLNGNLGYLGKLSVYRAMFFSEKDKISNLEQKDDWKAIDINWESTITASISKYIQVSFYMQLLYDKQISKKGRLKQTLAMGLVYKML